MAIISQEDWGKLHIAKLDGWTLSVCGDQHTLGSLIIFPPRKVEGSLTKLTDAELIEFKKIATLCEELLAEAFSAEWFNYSQAGNVVKRLHILLQPRYTSDRHFADHKFTDQGWGRPVQLLPAEELAPPEIVFAITKYLRTLLSTKAVQSFNVEIKTD